MVISGAAPAGILDILQPANLTQGMILKVRNIHLFCNNGDFVDVQMTNILLADQLL